MVPKKHLTSMLVALLCLPWMLSIAQTSQALNTPIFVLRPAKGIQRFVDRLDSPGIAYMDNNWDCHMISEMGLDEKVVKMEREDIPLWVDSNGIVKTQALVYSGIKKAVFVPHIKPFAVDGTLVYQGRGLMAIVNGSTLSLPWADASTSIAINRKGTEAITMSATANVYLLTKYSEDGSMWVPSDPPIAPTFDNLAFPGFGPGMNGMRYISDDKVVFVGGISSALDEEQLSKRCRAAMFIKSPIFKSETSTGAQTHVYLFLLDTKSGLVKPILEVFVPNQRERRGFSANNLTVSLDEKWVYVIGEEQYASLSIPAILKWSGSS